MTNEECKTHLKMVKKITPDNNRRNASDMTPCGVAFREWGKTEIDNLPEDFDWQEFWRDCKTDYPLHSVAGGYMFKNERKIKKEEYQKVPVSILPANKGKVLEIGYGFGGAAKLFKEKGIPEELLKKEGGFSMVYAENVFQHLTSKQRKEYYEQVHKILEPGGVFYFSLFTRNENGMKHFYSLEKNKNLPYACNFFGVHTKVPKLPALKRHLKKMGFDVISEKKRCTVDIRTDWTELALKKR